MITLLFNQLYKKMKKALRETQTLHAGCSKAEPKIIAPPQTSFPGAAGWPKLNQMVWYGIVEFNVPLDTV